MHDAPPAQVVDWYCGVLDVRVKQDCPAEEVEGIVSVVGEEVRVEVGVVVDYQAHGG